MANTDNGKQIFREKSIEQLSAPEQLTGYLRVTGIGLWVVLAGIVILMAGVLIWGIFGRIISTETVPAQVESGTAYCYILPEDLGTQGEEITIRIGDVDLFADPESAETVTLDASKDPELYRSGYLSAGRNVVILKAETTLTDGFYDAVVITEKLQPIRLLFAKN